MTKTIALFSVSYFVVVVVANSDTYDNLTMLTAVCVRARVWKDGYITRSWLTMVPNHDLERLLTNTLLYMHALDYHREPCLQSVQNSNCVFLLLLFQTWPRKPDYRLHIGLHVV